MEKNTNFIYKNLSPFKWFVLENFPFLEADYDALTDWQLFCKLGKEINKIINSENILGTQVETLTNYVKNYFDNLNVQEEINNKLNEMVIDGTLQEIITSYLQINGVLAFNTLDEMKNATNIMNGSICKTLGLNQYNDGKGGFYKIRKITNEDIIDEINIISLENTELIAERINNFIINDTSNPIYWGADPTGQIDSSDAINKCIEQNIHKQVNFTTGTYLINKPIEIDYNNYDGCIDFNNSTLINNVENDFTIGIGTKNKNLNKPSTPLYDKQETRFFYFKNIHLISKSNYSIVVERWFMNARLDNIQIYSYKNGIQIGKLYENYENKPTDLQLSNFLITSDDMSKNYIGINEIGSDNKFSDGRIYGFKTCINSSSLLILNNIHFLATNMSNITNFEEDFCCIKGNANIYAVNCYCDTYPTFYKSIGNLKRIDIINLNIYSYSQKLLYGKIFDFSECVNSDSTGYISLLNINFDNTNYPENSQLICLPDFETNVNDNLKSFIDNSNFSEIFYTLPSKLINIDNDIARSNNNLSFSNSYWPNDNINKWLKIANLINFQSSSLLLKVTTIYGDTIFRIRTRNTGEIYNIEKISGYNLHLGIKRKSQRNYELYISPSTDNSIMYSNCVTVNFSSHCSIILKASINNKFSNSITSDEVEMFT